MLNSPHESYSKNLMLRMKELKRSRPQIAQMQSPEHCVFQYEAKDFSFSALISAKTGQALEFNFTAVSPEALAVIDTFCEMAQGISISEYWIDALIRTEENLRDQALTAVPGVLVPLRFPPVFAPLLELLGAFRVWLDTQENLTMHRVWQARPLALEDLAKAHDLKRLEEKLAVLVTEFAQQYAPGRALVFAGLQAGPRVLIQIQDSASIAETGSILLALERYLRRHALAGLEVISDTWDDKNRRDQPRSWQVKPATEINGA